MASHPPTTPSRPSQQPFPYPATPQSRTPSTSANATPPTNLPASTSAINVKPTAPPISLAALLATHASAPNPHAAALDQALSERNQLSAQNTQLWKLIEKQRTAYNQVLKDLERVRGERDTLKGRLGLNKEKDRGLKGSSSNSTMASVGSTVNGSESGFGSTTEYKPTRHQSEDTALPRHRPSPQDLLQSRSKTTPMLSVSAEHEHELTDLDTQGSGGTSNSGTPTTATLPRTLAAPALSISPETPPPRTSTSSVPGSVPQTPFRNRNGSASSLEPVRRPPRNSSIGSIGNYNVYANGGSNSDAGPGAAPKLNTSNLPPSANETLSPTRAQPTSSLLSPPAGQAVPPVTGYSPMMQAGLAPHPHTSNTTTSANVSPSSLMPPAGSSGAGGMSRESRISLPDEAKRYIANMGESPMVSPQISNGFSLGAPPQVARTETGESEFMDMDDPVEEPESMGDEDEDEEDLGEVHNATSMATVTQNSNGRSTAPSPTKPARVDDFPLPPGGQHVAPSAPLSHQAQMQSQTHPRTQTQALTQQHQQQLQQQPSTGSYPQISVDGSDGLNTSPYLSNAASSSTSLFNNSASVSSLGQSILPQTQATSQSQLSMTTTSSPAFRALPLLATDLPSTRIIVSQSSVRPNDRGKDVLSFIVEIHPGLNKEPWKVEKLYSDVLGLDQRVRANVGRGVGKKIASLPEGKLWKDHAPAKVDQRKEHYHLRERLLTPIQAALEMYLQTLVNLPIKDKNEIIAFFCSDILREAKKPVHQAGYKEGYLTKRGKNFGGWKTRYFVLQGPVLEYYESRGGTHLGSITITGAQIGRQQRTGDRRESDDEKEYRHAFLIIEAKKGVPGSSARHVLCAESDAERDDWVEVLVRYVMGSYNDDNTPAFPASQPLHVSTGANVTQSGGAGQPRSSTSSQSPFGNNDNIPNGTPRKVMHRGMSKDDISRGPAVPISQLAPDSSNMKLFQSPGHEELRPSSPTKMEPSPIERAAPSFSDSDSARRVLATDAPISSSLPTSSPLDSAPGPGEFRANSEMGHYPDLQTQERPEGRHPQVSPERQRPRERERKSYHPSLNPSAATSSTSQDIHTAPEGTPARAKISGPLGGTVIPAGMKFGGKDAPPEPGSAADRREKAKSRGFWGFGKGGDKPAVAFLPRAVFGVTLEESLDVVQIANLPAVVFRSIQYLEAKKADQEEGIYRLSGSSAVIKGLKDRFNQEGDVDLLGSDDYWDPHAIAGLLKSYLRELPASILTRELHLRFLSVIDFVDPQERIKELSHLIASLPIANYSLLRALTAHLILIVQNANVNKMTMRNVGIVFSPTLGIPAGNANVNKMTMRNVGIVFSPTLGIPAGVFSLMLGEFNRVFNVDAPSEGEDAKSEDGAVVEDPIRRNSRQYTDAAADQMLGLSGRTLTAPVDEGQSDAESISLEYDDSGAESTEDSSRPSDAQSGLLETPTTPKATKAAHAAADRGLNIA
ncbi:hypothetical protein HWV62_1755, partial [Athelia sp. TMB]